MAEEGLVVCLQLRGRLLELRVEASCTVEELLQRIDSKTCIPVAEQRFPDVPEEELWPGSKLVADVPALVQSADAPLRLRGAQDQTRLNKKFAAANAVDVEAATVELGDLVEAWEEAEEQHKAPLLSRIATQVEVLEQVLAGTTLLLPAASRLLLEKCASLGGDVAAACQRVDVSARKGSAARPLRPGSRSVAELVDRLDEQFRSSGSVDGALWEDLRQAVEEAPSDVTSTHVDALLAVLEVTSDTNAVELFFTAQSGNPALLQQHHIDALLRMINANDDTSSLAVLVLVSLVRCRPDALGLEKAPAVFTAVDSASDSSLRFMAGPWLVQALCSSSDVCRSAGLDFLTHSIERAQARHRPLLLALMLLCSREGLLLRPCLERLSIAVGSLGLFGQLVAAVEGATLSASVDAFLTDLSSRKVIKLADVRHEAEALSQSLSPPPQQQRSSEKPICGSWQSFVELLEGFITTGRLCGLAMSDALLERRVQTFYDCRQLLASGAVTASENEQLQLVQERLHAKRVPLPLQINLVGVVRVTLEVQFVCIGRKPKCPYGGTAPFKTFSASWKEWIRVFAARAQLEFASGGGDAKLRQCVIVFEKLSGQRVDLLTALLRTGPSEEDMVRLNKELHESTFYGEFTQTDDGWICAACSGGTAAAQGRTSVPTRRGSAPRFRAGSKSKKAASDPTARPAAHAAPVAAPVAREAETFWDFCAKGDVAAVQDALARGQDVNAVDSANRTGLHHAVMCGRAELITILMQAKASVTVMDAEGKVPFMVPGASTASRDLVLRTLSTKQQVVADSASHHCLLCQAKFSFTNRRHHCRHCGLLTCGNCTTQKIELPSFGHPNPTRVCQLCYPQIVAAKKQLWK